MCEDSTRPGETFSPDGEGRLVFFEGAVYGGRAYGHEFIPDGGSHAEGGPLRYERQVRADEGGSKFSATAPEGCPDEAEGSDALIGVDFFARTGGGAFFEGRDFNRLPLNDENGLRRFRLVQDTQGVFPVFAAVYPDTFVRNG